MAKSLQGPFRLRVPDEAQEPGRVALQLRKRLLFFWSNGCSVGNLDSRANFLSSILYSPTSRVLVAKGTTNNSGGMGTNQNGYSGHNVATALSQGDSLGALTPRLLRIV
ncbi:hypothetical protein [Archangium lansingense]|uniref:Uncharacterized protein n=1 Tax=Archangium lansingense TaxID=2995310 RepID=A0ABT4A428_9BACT|nr:hypothetical protein [Archangium lansinium]MCY1075744.1 hypothetical protein [Archangium lansinium]